MNDDKTDWLERMVREAGWNGIYTEWVSPTERKSMTVPVTPKQVVKFAELVAAAEREACVCELPHKICTPEEYFFFYRPKGKHSVYFNYDAAGNTAIWYLTPNTIYMSEPKPNTGDNHDQN